MLSTKVRRRDAAIADSAYRMKFSPGDNTARLGEMPKPHSNTSKKGNDTQRRRCRRHRHKSGRTFVRAAAHLTTQPEGRTSMPRNHHSTMPWMSQVRNPPPQLRRPPAPSEQPRPRRPRSGPARAGAGSRPNHHGNLAAAPCCRTIPAGAAAECPPTEHRLLMCRPSRVRSCRWTSTRSWRETGRGRRRGSSQRRGRRPPAPARRSSSSPPSWGTERQ
jgi:hypothetical protein